MKTVEEVYQQIAASKELQEELKAASEERIQAFLKQQGCDADVKAFLSLVSAHGACEITDAEAEAVAGGWIPPKSRDPNPPPPVTPL